MFVCCAGQINLDLNVFANESSYSFPKQRSTIAFGYQAAVKPQNDEYG
jgi:hypothetical protein